MSGRTAPRRMAAALGLAVVLAGCAGTAPDEAGAATSSAPAGTTAEATDAAPRSAAGRHLTVGVAGGQVTGDTGRVPVGLGEEVTLTVTGDASDELHLHGYDLSTELVPGEPAVLTFTADIAGVFEVELHEAGTVLLSLQVG